ncbi:TonB-dependent siderophore receptor [Sporomusa termitida]|uniref:Ferrichrome outer membrane transporter/phage receptor n=1 Tax=Sporomusa termitida TaxID=2377 RepID=A0A517E044_9FIRM|nr:TonB-dependent siderophore receptor [Sporomusa termitida]QDR82985.1 Ferrichrome outer membrane transporter/phage receptor [Sporomusa termitida]
MKKRTLSPAKKRLLYALIGSSLFWQYPVYAAAEAAQPPSEQAVRETAAAGDATQREFALEGVEVTAAKDAGYVAKRSSVSTKTDTPLNETAQSISVVTREQMEARAVQTLDEAIAYTPGITPTTYGKDARGYSYVLIRGLSSGNYSSFTDGLRNPVGVFATASTDTYAFDRIEILRGPASILYGANAPGGLFNQVTKQPPEQELHEIQVQAGNNANKSIALDVGGPARADGKLLFRLTARTQEQDFERDYSSGRSVFIAPALTWKPAADTKLTILANYQKNDIKGFATGTRGIFSSDSPLYGYPSTLFIGEPGYDRFEREQKQIGYIFEHKFNDMWSVTQTARHSDIDIKYKYIDIGGLSSDGRTLERVAYSMPETLSADTIDTHFQAKWSNGEWAHTALLGLDYQRRNFDSRWLMGSAPSLDLVSLNYGQAVTAPTTPFYSQLSHMRQRGLYLQEQAKLGDRWVFLAGGRRDWYENDANSIKQTANTGRAGIVYHATDELSPYISYTKSFEPQAGADRYGKAFVPTTGTQYELGVQYQPAGSTARFTAAVFDLRQQNVLTADPLNEIYTGPEYNVQTGEVASKGLELEAQLTPVKGLNIIAAYTFLDNKTTKSTVATDIGNRTAGIAKHVASLWTDYTIQEGKLKRLGFGGGLRYIGSRYNSANTVKHSGVVVTDAMIRYDLDEWRLALNARNLFDKFYDVGTGYAGEGRTVLLTATHRW